MSTTSTSSHNQNMINYSYKKGLLSNSKSFLHKSSSVKHIKNISNYNNGTNGLSHRKLSDKYSVTPKKTKTRNIGSNFYGFCNNTTSNNNNTNNGSHTFMNYSQFINSSSNFNKISFNEIGTKQPKQNKKTSYYGYGVMNSNNSNINRIKNVNYVNKNSIKNKMKNYLGRSNSNVNYNQFNNGNGNTKYMFKSFLEISEEINQSNLNEMNHTCVNKNPIQFNNQTNITSIKEKNKSKSVISLKRKKINLSNPSVNGSFMNFSNRFISKTIKNKNEQKGRKGLNISDDFYIRKYKGEALLNNNTNNNNLSERTALNRNNYINMKTSLVNGDNNMEGPEEYHFVLVKILQKQKRQMVIMDKY